MIDQGFPPIVGDAPRWLILGSMPGQASLAAQQYYAHPRNQFWPLMEALFEVDARAPYPERAAALAAAGVAVWDVLAACERPGSLDASIRRGTEVVNPIGPFVAARPTLQVVATNGAAAARLLARVPLPAVQRVALPSTSPAHASRSFADKLARWRHGLLGA